MLIPHQVKRDEKGIFLAPFCIKENKKEMEARREGDRSGRKIRMECETDGRRVEKEG